MQSQIILMLCSLYDSWCDLSFALSSPALPVRRSPSLVNPTLCPSPHLIIWKRGKRNSRISNFNVKINYLLKFLSVVWENLNSDGAFSQQSQHLERQDSQSIRTSPGFVFGQAWDLELGFCLKYFEIWIFSSLWLYSNYLYVLHFLIWSIANSNCNSYLQGNCAYTWYKNDHQSNNSSGINKQICEFKFCKQDNKSDVWTIFHRRQE